MCWDDVEYRDYKKKSLRLMKSSQEYKFVAREREKVAFRIYLFLIQRNKTNSKTNSGICVISYKQG